MCFCECECVFSSEFVTQFFLSFILFRNKRIDAIFLSLCLFLSLSLSLTFSLIHTHTGLKFAALPTASIVIHADIMQFEAFSKVIYVIYVLIFMCYRNVLLPSMQTERASEWVCERERERMPDVCMYVFMYVCYMHVYVYVYVCVCVCVRVCVCRLSCWYLLENLH